MKTLIQPLSILTMLLLALFISSCYVTNAVNDANKARPSTDVPAPRVPSATYMLDTSSVFQGHFTGFALFDPQEQQFWDTVWYDKYFTPASNTKLLTYYTALSMLPDSLPALQYVIRGDSLIFWGTGDPSLLNPDFEDNNTVIEFLKSRKERLYYLPQPMDARWGAGLAWDDYNYDFMTERNDLPMYGNLSHWTFPKNASDAVPLMPTCHPKYFEAFLTKATQAVQPSILREEGDNKFYYRAPKGSSDYKRDVPFKVSHATTAALLSDAVQRSVQLLNYDYNKSRLQSSDAKTIRAISKQDALKELMQPSNNMVAEQLLLMCSFQQFKRFDTKRIIKYAKKEIIKNEPDRMAWYDASGMSRYNMLTPRTMVHLWNAVYQEYGEALLLETLAAGGKRGTIKGWYKSETDTPYIYAKTGTLKHNHCLSGFIKTNSGRTLIFVFMNNHYASSSKPIKKEMQKVLEFIRDRY